MLLARTFVRTLDPGPHTFIPLRQVGSQQALCSSQTLMWPFSSGPQVHEFKQQQEASCASPGTVAVAADELRPEQQHAGQLDAAHGWSWWRSPSPASSPPGTSSDGISSSSSSRSSTAAAAAAHTGQAAAAADAPPANSHHASQQPGTSQRGWSSWWRTQSGSSSSSLPSPAAAAVTAATATLSSTFPAQATQAGLGALQGSKQAIADPSSGSSTNQQQQQQQQQQRPSARSLETVEVQPLHVVLAGTAVMAVGEQGCGQMCGTEYVEE